MKGTYVYGSPRKGGTTDKLMDMFLSISKNKLKIDPAVFKLREMNISPCIECYGCEKSHGSCVINDDMHGLYDSFLSSELIVLSAPVFFYGFNAMTKAMVDRIQALWVKKHVLKKPVGGKRFGVLITAGATRGEKLFEGVTLTFRYFLEPMNGEVVDVIAFRGMNSPEDVKAREKEVREKIERSVTSLSSILREVHLS